MDSQSNPTPALYFTTYTDIKTIKATPMTRFEAETYLSREIKTSHESEDGYLVKYPDGYESWSPAEVFEAAYRKSDTYLDRMIIEKDELREKILKAEAFLFSDKCLFELDEKRRELLRSQIDCMKLYMDALRMRISAELRELSKETIDL